MAISLTESAAERVRSRLATRGRGLGLRLGASRPAAAPASATSLITPMKLAPDDLVFDSHGVKVFVDPASLARDRRHAHRLRAIRG